MRGLFKLTVNEVRLILREPAIVFFNVFFPTMLVVILGLVPSLRQPEKSLGGLRVIDVYVPTAIMFSLVRVALVTLPTYLSTYREKGILRRLAVTPMPPTFLLAAQLLMNLALAIIAVGVVLAVGQVGLQVTLPQQIAGYILAFVLAAGALFASGLAIAALAPSGHTAVSIGTLLSIPLMFFGGLFIPLPLIPDVLRRIGDFTPAGAGVQALQDATGGQWPQPLHLAVMAAYVVVFGAVAARWFRWE